jgi:hypothetical protein
VGNRRIVATSMLITVVAALTACGGSGSTISAVDKAPVKFTKEVLYEVEGTTKYASVTYETPTGTSQSNPDIPMKKKSSSTPGLTFTFDAGDFVYISAQSKTASGTVICRITVDGKVISQNSASGYGVASCKGSA